MIKTLFRKNFEPTHHAHLPPQAARILHGVVREFESSGRSAAEHEMAHATLHMRLYQHFGHQSSDIVSEADKLLHKLVGPKATA
ncbi:MAG TPA: hypothetical protein PK096_00415 [Candidatus Saccharibacteria bacterium]|nr:hypothetical protein [Candidatus Saccharibacteria bacterium]HRK93819.1 hypothetical protein [Candidatus Saccharibacteria bacterium]